MKQILTLILISLFISCGREKKNEPLYPESVTENKQTPEQIGQEIFESKGNCVACHQPEQKIVGPSIAEIAQIYKDKGGDIVSFLKGNEEPLVDPSQFEVMKTNFAFTKNMSDTELQALESYIYSFAK